MAEVQLGTGVRYGGWAVKHSETSYLVMGLTILIACFVVIVIHLFRGGSSPTEAWLTVGAVVGHYFGRSGNGHTNGNGAAK